MNMLAKIATAATLAGGLAAGAAVPADAGVSVGVGIGVPAGPAYPHRHWCYYHPGACGRPGVVVAAPAPVYAEGFYLAGHGYWHGGRWWGHRVWFRGAWVYR